LAYPIKGFVLTKQIIERK